MGALGAVGCIWAFVIIYPKKHGLPYFSRFTFIAALSLFALLFLLLYIISAKA